ncbi:PREDICTED: rosmarinate synthase-like [Erythranthe guttata]|uniref:rosmarinate synthase-like n=1 Tax=Erythranthe guttata TaxID=4155 RepID=UPI00064D9BF1|nr:PREDICTED: rosmarinate synthase-like [Erythranthe guttata]|eukprot:XP_012855779.1 PREDICTED: rosmarinate synthase-like [Erythranthe guttata]
MEVVSLMLTDKNTAYIRHKISLRITPEEKPVQSFNSDPLLNPCRQVSSALYRFPARKTAGELTDKLRESISDMLSYFPMVTGRLLRTSDGDWTVKCNDAGLRMVEAKVMKGSVEKWLRNVDRKKELKLVHWEEMFYKPYFWSTFYVQITEFEGGGLAIGLSCTRLLSDPICATMMIKAWADTTLIGEITSPPLFRLLPVPNRNTNHHSSSLIDRHKSYLTSSPVPKSDSNTKQITTITLQFNQETVKKLCIAMVNDVNGRGPGPTPFQALAGLFWTCISRAKGMKRGLVDMSVCLDMRKALGLDKGFFGNSKRWDWTRAFSETPWCTISGCDDDHLICVDLENVDCYSAVFEENVVPIRVSYYMDGPGVGAGQILVMPAPGGGDGPESRVVAVTLPEDEAEKVLEDSLIRQLGPITLMGLNKNPN